MRRSGSGDSVVSRCHSSRTSRADAGVGRDRDQVRIALPYRACVVREQEIELGVAADECAVQPTHPARTRQRQCAQQRLRLDTALLSFRLDDATVAELERSGRERGRAYTDEDLARRSRLLEPRRDVDGVAGDERAAFAGAAHNHVAGVHADAQRELLSEQCTQPPLHRERRVQRALRVILERSRCTERGHYGVAGKLFYRAACRLDLAGHRVVEALERRSGALGIL